MPRASRVRRPPSVRMLGLALVLACGTGAGDALAQSMQTVSISAPLASSTSPDNSATWDEIDRQVSLTGLWGSIDPYLDAHPALYTRPSDGRLFLFWSKWNGQFYEIVFTSRGAGESWGLLLEVTPQPDSTMDNIQPRVVSDASGRLNVVWIRTSGSGGSVYHAVRFGTSWTPPTRLSGEESARRPAPRVDTQGRTLVDYRTSREMVTVEVVVVVSAGGSDDIDPTQEGAVDVESYELLREVILK